MTIYQFDLTDKFKYILKNIILVNTSDNIVAKVNNSYISFKYVIKTDNKDLHRKTLKRYFSDSCISNVVGENTNILVTFGFVNSIVLSDFNYGQFNSFTFEFSKNSKPNEIIQKILFLLKNKAA